MKKKNILEFTASMKEKTHTVEFTAFMEKKGVLEFTAFMKKEKKTCCNLNYLSQNYLGLYILKNGFLNPFSVSHSIDIFAEVVRSEK